jgi:hypothetical protein
MAKVKIPKRVAGVKIPKKVRKQANRALKLANSPVAREVAAAAVGAAAAKADRGTLASAARTAMTDPDRFVEALRSSALEGFSRFLEGFEEGLRDAAASVEEVKPDRPKPGAANGGSRERAAAD